MPEQRLFLERRSYRRRRMMDAVRILPLICAVLWLVVPAMWPNGDPQTGARGASQQTPLSHAIWYIFVVWVLAITAAFALWVPTLKPRARRGRGRSARGAGRDGGVPVDESSYRPPAPLSDNGGPARISDSRAPAPPSDNRAPAREAKRPHP